MGLLVDPVRHPALTRLMGSGVMSEPDDPDYEFVFGLARLLDGTEALIRQQRTGGQDIKSG